MTPDAPPMPMPLPAFAQKKGKQNASVSTYDVESPELQSLAMMGSLDDFKDAGNEDNDFVELQDIEKLMSNSKKTTRKTNGKRKR